jgi:hypothetical protein
MLKRSLLPLLLARTYAQQVPLPPSFRPSMSGDRDDSSSLNGGEEAGLPIFPRKNSECVCIHL